MSAAAGPLPGLHSLRLHPNEHTQGGAAAAHDTATTQNTGAVDGDAPAKEAEVSFKDLATLVTVLLDRNRQEGDPPPARSQGAPFDSRPAPARAVSSQLFEREPCSLRQERVAQRRSGQPPAVHPDLGAGGGR